MAQAKLDHSHPENLKVGEWITVTAWKHWRETEIIDGMTLTKEKPTFSGEPAQVLAISYPFIAIKDWEDDRYTIDLRAYNIVKVSLKYVEALIGLEDDGDLLEEKTMKENSRGCCPACGDTLAERKQHGAISNWEWYCKCGFEGRVIAKAQKKAIKNVAK